MTITRISPGVWELRTRHGTLIATGDLHHRDAVGDHATRRLV